MANSSGGTPMARWRWRCPVPRTLFGFPRRARGICVRGWRGSAASSPGDGRSILRRASGAAIRTTSRSSWLRTRSRQARAVVGDKCVGVGAADIVRQCLAAGLLDEIVVNLVPVLLGKGMRFFDQFAAAPIALDTPRVVEGTGVTHLYYRVRPR